MKTLIMTNSRKSIVCVFAPLFFLLLPLAAQNAEYKSDPDWNAPDKFIQLKNPLEGKPDMAAGGKKIFQSNCAECHGEEGGGSSKAPDLKSPLVQSQTDGALFWKIASGNPKRGMPGWSRLPQNQRWQVVLFLRSLARKAENANKPIAP